MGTRLAAAKGLAEAALLPLSDPWPAEGASCRGCTAEGLPAGQLPPNSWCLGLAGRPAAGGWGFPIGPAGQADQRCCASRQHCCDLRAQQPFNDGHMQTRAGLCDPEYGAGAAAVWLYTSCSMLHAMDHMSHIVGGSCTPSCASGPTVWLLWSMACSMLQLICSQAAATPDGTPERASFPHMGIAQLRTRTRFCYPRPRLWALHATALMYTLAEAQL